MNTHAVVMRDLAGTVGAARVHHIFVQLVRQRHEGARRVAPFFASGQVCGQAAHPKVEGRIIANLGAPHQLGCLAHILGFGLPEQAWRAEIAGGLEPLVDIFPLGAMKSQNQGLMLN